MPWTPGNPTRGMAGGDEGVRWRCVAAGAVWVACALLGVVNVALVIGAAPLGNPDSFGSPLLDGLAVVAYLSAASVGALIAARHPRMRLGWVLLVAAVVTMLGSAAEEYGEYVVLGGLAWPAGNTIGWVGAWTWELGIGLALAFLALLFPDGCLPSRAWRPAAWAAGVAVGANTVIRALFPGPRNPAAQPFIEPPFGFVATNGLLENARHLGWLLVAAMVLLGTAALVARIRHADVERRQQLKWLAYAGAWIVALLPLRYVTHAWWANALLLSATFAFPAALGVAVLRYRLYEIDRLISRTVSYGLLTGLLGVLYVALALGLGWVLVPLSASVDVALVVSAVAVAVIVRPARRRLQTAVDRRFNRARYDAARAIEGFRDRLRDELQLDQVSVELLAALTATVNPTTASLWLVASPSTGSARAGVRHSPLHQPPDLGAQLLAVGTDVRE